MEMKMLEILETATIAVGGFLIKKYILLEPDMEAKKQRIFYWVSFLLTGIVFIAFGKDAATIAVLLLIGLNICLGRKEHRLRGLFYMIPFLGIINGLIFPVLFVPPYRFALTERAALVYQFATYAVIAILFLLFYVKGRGWRRWMRENMQNRSLRKSEKYMLWAVGILALILSNQITMFIVQPFCERSPMRHETRWLLFAF